MTARLGFAYHGELAGGKVVSDHDIPGPDINTSAPLGDGTQTIAIRSPSPPVDDRTPAEIAADNAAFREWRNYALIRGRERYLGSMEIGAKGWIYFDPALRPWHMRAEFAIAGADVTVTIKVLAAFGRLNADLAPRELVAGTYQFTDAVLEANAALLDFIPEPSPDGRELLINWYGEAAPGPLISTIVVATGMTLLRVDRITVSGTGDIASQATVGDGITASGVGYKTQDVLQTVTFEEVSTGVVVDPGPVTIQIATADPVFVFVVNCAEGQTFTEFYIDRNYQFGTDFAAPVSSLSGSYTATTTEFVAAMYYYDALGVERVISATRVLEEHRTNDSLVAGAERNRFRDHYDCSDPANPVLVSSDVIPIEVLTAFSGSSEFVQTTTRTTTLTNGAAFHQAVSVLTQTQSYVPNGEFVTSISLQVSSTSDLVGEDPDRLLCNGHANCHMVETAGATILGEQGAEFFQALNTVSRALQPIKLTWAGAGGRWV